MNTYRLPVISLLPQIWSFLPFQVLSSWVFLHKKSNFTLPRERWWRHLRPATALEALQVFPCRSVTQEDIHEEASMPFLDFVFHGGSFSAADPNNN
jgi:hypothetical protein